MTSTGPIIRTLLAASILLGGASCASTQRYQLDSASGYDSAFRSVAQTLPSLDWFTESSDSNTGIITATRRITGARTTDRQLRLSILVRDRSPGVEIEATFIPPGLAFGNADGEMDELASALRTRLPDVEIARRQ